MEALATALAPGAALLVSALTLYLTQRRTNAIDARAAAKDTVDLLAKQNKAQASELIDLNKRVDHLELTLADCERHRDVLLMELLALQKRAPHTEADPDRGNQ